MIEFVEFAQSIALEAGEIMQSQRANRLRIKHKPDRTLVTEIDIAINELVIDAVVKNFPNYSIIGEEASLGPANAEYIVHVDPLDGTGEYLDADQSSEPSYGFGLALQRASALELGLFFNPSKGEMFTAIKGLGSFLNNKKISVNNRVAHPGVPYDYSDWENADYNLRSLQTSFGQPIGHHSAIYQACTVAVGISAFCAFPGNTAHDIAPASLIVSEAGGKVSDIYGNRHDYRKPLHGAVFSNTVSHDTAIKVISI